MACIQQQQQQQGHGHVTDPRVFWRLDLENAAPRQSWTWRGWGGGGGNRAFFGKGDFAFSRVYMEKVVFAWVLDTCACKKQLFQ